MADEPGIWSPYLEPARNATVAVPTTNTEIATVRALQSPRKVLVIRNISPNAADTISLSFGQPAVVNVGVVLRQYDVYSESVDKGYAPYQGTINAICATATGVLALEER